MDTATQAEAPALAEPSALPVPSPRNIVQIYPLIGQGAVLALCQDSSIWLGSLLIPRNPESQITWVNIWTQP